MMRNSLISASDVIVYDLEDSVPPSATDKNSARQRLHDFLKKHPTNDERIAVRVNDTTTPFFHDDIAEALQHTSVTTLVLPKIHSAQDLHIVSREICNTYTASPRDPNKSPLRIVASIESAKSLWNIGTIAAWKSEYGPHLGGSLSALLFAAEDYCADTSIIRTPSRRELLYTRSQVVVAAKAFGVEAIDMVCLNYKSAVSLTDECRDGRELGFTGKQAIHPNQVDVIKSTFVPTSAEILRAATILHQMKAAHASQKGAIGLELKGGGTEMIDAPMIKQAENTIKTAKAAGLDIPHID
jgi:citrate lyase subunit beta-like protein